ARDLPPQVDPVVDDTSSHAAAAWAVDNAMRGELQRAMTRGAGVLRSADSLAAAAATPDTPGTRRATPNTPNWAGANLLTNAPLLVAAASQRTETRGCHWREDFPDADPAWLGHLVASVTPDCTITEAWQAMPVAAERR